MAPRSKRAAARADPRTRALNALTTAEKDFERSGFTNTKRNSKDSKNNKGRAKLRRNAQESNDREDDEDEEQEEEGFREEAVHGSKAKRIRIDYRVEDTRVLGVPKFLDGESVVLGPFARSR